MHLVMHESFESPAAFASWAKARSVQVSYSRVYDGDELPQRVDDIDFLVVMGGPQSPATTTAECSHFDSIAEQALIKKAIVADKLVLGVCLGAQLIGEALGAKFEHSPHQEIGVFDVTLTEEGRRDPFFSTLPGPTFRVAHWHGDMPGLTADAKLLAFSEGCPRQIVRYTRKVYAFQCHFEFTVEAINGMLEFCAHELETGGRYIESAATLRRHDYREMNEILFAFLDHLVRVGQSSNSAGHSTVM